MPFSHGEGKWGKRNRRTIINSCIFLARSRWKTQSKGILPFQEANIVSLKKKLKHRFILSRRPTDSDH